MAAMSSRAVSAHALWQLKIANYEISKKAVHASDLGHDLEKASPRT
jgi:hypothetical protein